MTIAIETSNQLVDFSHGYSDVAIRFGSGKYPGLRAERLLCESSNVVCTPSTLSSYLHDNGEVDDLDIARLRFVNDRGKTGTALKPELSDWLRANEREESEPKMDTAFSDSSHAIQHVLQNGSFMLARRAWWTPSFVMEALLLRLASGFRKPLRILQAIPSTASCVPLGDCFFGG